MSEEFTILEVSDLLECLTWLAASSLINILVGFVAQQPEHGNDVAPMCIYPPLMVSALSLTLFVYS